MGAGALARDALYRSARFRQAQLVEDVDLEGALVDGRFRVGRRLGSGGSSVVFAAEHIGLDVAVALKVLRRERAADAAQVEQFFHEAKVLRVLHHPHIVSVLGAGRLADEHEQLPYVALAWCGESTLADVLKATQSAPPRTPSEAWSWLAPVVDAVAHAHRRGVVHGDLTPRNIMIETRGNDTLLRVIDFGVARLGTGERGAFTRAYAAPEQVAGRTVGPATDVHALGLIFLEVLSQRPPYGSEPGLAAIDEERPSAKRLGADAGPWAAPLARALRLAPEERFEDAGALFEALTNAARELTPSTTGGLAASVAAHPSRPPPARKRLTRGLAGAALATLVALGVGAASRLRQPATPIADLDIRAVTTRVEQAGFPVSSRAANATGQRLTLFTGDTVSTLSIHPLVTCDDVATCEREVRDALIRLTRRPNSTHQPVAYASDARATLFVVGDDAASVQRIRDAAIDGLDAPIVGNLDITEHPSDEGTAATTFASLTPGSLDKRLQQAGFVVSWSGEGKDGVKLMAAYAAHGDVGNATLFRGHVPEVLRSIDEQPEPYAWARAGELLLVLRGPGEAATATALQLVIAGTDARVGGSRR